MAKIEPAVSVYGAPSPVRMRTRTPGKHIVLALTTAVLLLVVTTSILSPGQNDPAHAGRDRVATLLSKQEIRLDPFLVDLSPDAFGRQSLMRLEVTIVAADPGALQALRSEGAVLRERLLFFLREMTPEDFAGGESMERVKAELLRRVNLVIAPYAANQVVINEILVQ